MPSAELITAYLSGANTLAQAVDGLDDAQLRARPVAGTWSILENVCHLADSEGLFAERMKRVLADDRPALPVADENRFMAALACHHRDAAEELAYVRAVRQQMARILRAQPPEAWSRVGIHSTDGPKSLELLLRKSVDHLEHHLDFVRRKRQMVEAAASPRAPHR